MFTLSFLAGSGMQKKFAQNDGLPLRLKFSRNVCSLAIELDQKFTQSSHRPEKSLLISCHRPTKSLLKSCHRPKKVYSKVVTDQKKFTHELSQTEKKFT
jgi:hypothetical protein